VNGSNNKQDSQLNYFKEKLKYNDLALEKINQQITIWQNDPGFSSRLTSQKKRNNFVVCNDNGGSSCQNFCSFTFVDKKK
jgi:hypothetical protein